MFPNLAGDQTFFDICLKQFFLRLRGCFSCDQMDEKRMQAESVVSRDFFPLAPSSFLFLYSWSSSSWMVAPSPLLQHLDEQTHK
jgi:hypothetical protein